MSALSSYVKLGALTNVTDLGGLNDLDLHSYATDRSLKAHAKNQGAEPTAQLPKAWMERVCLVLFVVCASL